MSSTLAELCRPFPPEYVHKNPSGGGTFVKHHVVEQRLIMVLGVPPHFTLTEIVRGDVPAIAPNPNGNSKRAREGRPALQNVVVGVIARMQVEIDNRSVIVDEAGDCEQPHNWDTDGQRLKDAMSDAYKRCAMRLGCGLHLWSQNEFFLYDELSSGEGASVPEQSREVSPQAETGSPPSSSDRTSASPHPSEASGGDAVSEPTGDDRQGGEPPSTPLVADSPPAASWQDNPWPVIEQARKDGRVDVAQLIREAGGVAKRNQTMKLVVSPGAIEKWPVEAIEQLVYALGIIPSGQGELV